MKTVITGATQNPINFREIYRYRELIYALVLKEIKLRYRQTFLGVVWALLQPSLSSFIIVFIFSSLFGETIQTPDYVLYVFLGMLFWMYFTQALTLGASSYINNQSLVAKIYVPRFLLPLSMCLVPLIDFTVGYLAYIALTYFLSPVPFYRFFFVGGAFILLFIFVSALSLIWSLLNVKYRDVRYVLPFFTQLIFFATPIIYPLDSLKNFGIFLFLNPLTSIIELARFFINPGYQLNLAGLAVSSGVIIVIVFLSLKLFTRYNGRLADYL